MFPCPNLQQSPERGASDIHKLPVKGDGPPTTPLPPRPSPLPPRKVLIVPAAEVGVGRERGSVFVVEVFVKKFGEYSGYEEGEVWVGGAETLQNVNCPHQKTTSSPAVAYLHRVNGV